MMINIITKLTKHVLVQEDGDGYSNYLMKNLSTKRCCIFCFWFVLFPRPLGGKYKYHHISARSGSQQGKINEFVIPAAPDKESLILSKLVSSTFIDKVVKVKTWYRPCLWCDPNGFFLACQLISNMKIQRSPYYRDRISCLSQPSWLLSSIEDLKITFIFSLRIQSDLSNFVPIPAVRGYNILQRYTGR